MAIYSWFTNSTRWIVHSYVSLPESNIFGISWNHQPPTGFFANRASQSQRSQENVRHCPTWSGSGWALACCCFCSCLMVTDFRGMEPPKVSTQAAARAPSLTAGSQAGLGSLHFLGLSWFIYVYLILPPGVLIWSLLPSFPKKTPRICKGFRACILSAIVTLGTCIMSVTCLLDCCAAQFFRRNEGFYESFTMSWNQQWNHTESKRLRLFLMGHGSASMDSGWEPFGLSDKVSEFHFDQLNSAFGLSKSYL